MTRRPVSFPNDIPSSDAMFDSETVWRRAGAGGEWPWLPATSVYFLQGADSGMIRIGIAKDVQARIASHRSSSAEELTWLGDMPGGIALERQFHSTFSALRHKGSWYLPDQSLLDTISRVVVL